ncbi:MAG: hypothetical protein INF92_07925 [Rhodobacter sp.]|jgi:hypothetical protein|nr:hypothetical protein [Rhodobacter sp.]
MPFLRGIIPCAPLFAVAATGAGLTQVEGDGLFGAGHRRGGDSDLPALVRGHLCRGGAGQGDTGGVRAGCRGADHRSGDDRAGTAEVGAWCGGRPVAAWPPSPPARWWNLCGTGAAHDPGRDRPWTAILVPGGGTCLIRLSFAGLVCNRPPQERLLRHLRRAAAAGCGVGHGSGGRAGAQRPVGRAVRARDV